MYKVVFKFLNINNNKTIPIDKIDFKMQKFYAGDKVFNLKDIADGEISKKQDEIEILLVENIGISKRMILTGEFHTSIGVYNIIAVDKGIAILSNGKGADLSKVFDVETSKLGSKLSLTLKNSKEMLAINVTSLIDKNASDKVMTMDLIGKALYTKNSEFKFYHIKEFKCFKEDYKTKINIIISMTAKSKFLLTADLILKDGREIKAVKIEGNRLVFKSGSYEIKGDDEIKITEYKGDRFELKVYEG